MKTFVRLFLLTSLLIVSCAQVPNYEKEHQSFLSMAQRAKSEMEPAAYKKWLTQKISEKESHIQAIGGWEEREGRIYSQHEMVSSSSATSSAGPQTSDFQANSSELQMRRYQDQKRYIQKELFYLRSQLSALESTP